MTSPSSYRRYRYILAPESPANDTDSTETVYSMQDRETEYVRDESDTCTKSTTSEYTVYSFQAETNPFLDTESSGDIIETRNLIVETRLQFSTSSENVDGDDSTSDDPELGQADYWNCVQCFKSNNHPKYRYCMKCFRLRKELFPPPPKRTKKRQLIVNKDKQISSSNNISIRNNKRKHSTDSEIEFNRNNLNSKTLKLDETFVKASNQITKIDYNQMDVATNIENLNETVKLDKPLKKSITIENNYDKTPINIFSDVLKPNKTLEKFDKPMNITNTLYNNDKTLNVNKIDLNVDLSNTACQNVKNTDNQLGTVSNEQENNLTTLANIACNELNNIRKKDDANDDFLNQSSLKGNSGSVKCNIEGTNVTPSNSNIVLNKSIHSTSVDSGNSRITDNSKLMTDSDTSLGIFKKPISCDLPNSTTNSPFNSTSSLCSVLNKFEIDSNLGQLKKLTPTYVTSTKNDINLTSALHLETPKTSRTFQELCEEVEKRQFINSNSSNNTSSGQEGSFVDQDSGFSSPSMCIMCERGPKNAGFVHSDRIHISSCYPCALKVWKITKRCPTCNSRTSKVLKVIVS